MTPETVQWAAFAAAVFSLLAFSDHLDRKYLWPWRWRLGSRSEGAVAALVVACVLFCCLLVTLAWLSIVVAHHELFQ